MIQCGAEMWKHPPHPPAAFFPSTDINLAPNLPTKPLALGLQYHSILDSPSLRLAEEQDRAREN
ncbi:AGAP013227-PA [Anopheles gambiae str. PEST]|uniref:AGAP013227-PA n=2 Tax=gambiae species complex TaxID=44542 RepID=F5HKX1_ANOGA|nr:AGAP013227-PA [Anopheles gambiae str. PEST]